MWSLYRPLAFRRLSLLRSLSRFGCSPSCVLILIILIIASALIFLRTSRLGVWRGRRASVCFGRLVPSLGNRNNLTGLRLVQAMTLQKTLVALGAIVNISRNFLGSRSVRCVAYVAPLLVIPHSSATSSKLICEGSCQSGTAAKPDGELTRPAVALRMQLMMSLRSSLSVRSAILGLT